MNTYNSVAEHILEGSKELSSEDQVAAELHDYVETTLRQRDLVQRQRDLNHPDRFRSGGFRPDPELVVVASGRSAGKTRMVEDTARRLGWDTEVLDFSKTPETMTVPSGEEVLESVRSLNEFLAGGLKLNEIPAIIGHASPEETEAQRLDRLWKSEPLASYVSRLNELMNTRNCPSGYLMQEELDDITNKVNAEMVRLRIVEPDVLR